MKVLSLKFSRASKTYEEWAIPQRLSAEILKQLDTIEGSVLDVGCGTGFSSMGLKNVVGIDLSLSMLKVYKSKGFIGICADANFIPFKDKSFDSVISNFALHWMDINMVFEEIFRVCRKKFLCAMPVEGSIKELNFPFYSAEDVLKKVQSLGGKLRRVEIKTIDIPFEGWDLIRFFHYTGSSYNPSNRDFLKSKKSIETLLFSIDKPSFVVLFFSCEVYK
ncbi:class I SAM-dependent methyltransferase [Thermocrinis sp.]